MIIPNSRSSSQCIHTYMHVIYEHICLQLTGRYVYFQKHAICLMVPLVILFCSEDKQRQHTLIMLSSFILVADQLKMYTLFQSQPWFHILYIIQCGCCCFSLACLLYCPSVFIYSHFNTLIYSLCYHSTQTQQRQHYLFHHSYASGECERALYMLICSIALRTLSTLT